MFISKYVIGTGTLDQIRNVKKLSTIDEKIQRDADTIPQTWAGTTSLQQTSKIHSCVYYNRWNESIHVPFNISHWKKVCQYQVVGANVKLI